MNNLKHRLLPVIVLSTSGHNGVDWMHSLLDSHKQILLLPAFSFFRTILRLKEALGVGNLAAVPGTKIIAVLVDILLSPAYQGDRRRLFGNKDEARFFETHFLKVYETLDEVEPVKRIFYAIHHAFAHCKNIDLHSKQLIVVHEHVPWYAKDYETLFAPKFLFVIRDPRAALAGAWIRQRRPNHGKFDAYRFDHTLFYLTYFMWFFNHCKKCHPRFPDDFYFIKNEEMHYNLLGEMTKLARWMNIEFEPTLLEETFSGKVHYGESVYLAVDDLTKPPPDDYYLPANIEARWRSALTVVDIKKIEWLAHDIFVIFGYEKDNTSRAFSRFCHFILLLFSNHYMEQKRPLGLKMLIFHRNIMRRMVILFGPRYAHLLFKIK